MITGRRVQYEQPAIALQTQSCLTQPGQLVGLIARWCQTDAFKTDFFAGVALDGYLDPQRFTDVAVAGGGTKADATRPPADHAERQRKGADEPLGLMAAVKRAGVHALVISGLAPGASILRCVLHVFGLKP